MKSGRTLTLISFILFLTVLTFCPLAFATVETWSYTLAQLLIFASFALYLGGSLFCRQIPFYAPPGGVSLILLCSYCFVQLLPLPPEILKVVSPQAWNIYTRTLWQISPGTWMPLSLVPAETINEFFRFASFTCLYVLAIQQLSRPNFLKITTFVLTGLSALIALVAILQRFTSPESIYWLRDVTGKNPFGPWVNRNHYAGFMEMVLPLVVALFLHYRPRIRYRYSLRQKIAMALSLPESNIHTLLGLGALLIFVSIFLSLSRSGIASASISLLLFCLLISGAKFHSRNPVLAMVSVLLVVLSVSWFGWQPIIERFENVLTAEGEIADVRPQVWLDSLSIIKDFPVTGTGFGTFAESYRAYRSVPGRFIFSHAHNDYIEHFSDSGIIGVLLASLFLLSIFKFSIVTIRSRRERFSILLFYGSLCGVIALLLHSITDFNLHIGANFYFIALFLALMVTSATTRFHNKDADSHLSITGNRFHIVVISIPVYGLLIFSFIFHLGLLRSRYSYYDIQKAVLYKGMSSDRIHELETVTRAAIENDPLNPQYHSALANILVLRDGNEATLPLRIKALKLNPLSCESLQQLANSLTDSSHERANSLHETSVVFNRQQGDCITRSAEWFFRTGQRSKALEILHNALHSDPSEAGYFFELMQRHTLTELEIQSIFPRNANLYREYASRLRQAGNESEAVAIYEKSLLFLQETTNLPRHHFYMGYDWYQKLGQQSKALELMQKAVIGFPDDPSFHELLGDLYLAQNIPYRALEEYNQALTLDPTQKRIITKIEKLQKK